MLSGTSLSRGARFAGQLVNRRTNLGVQPHRPGLPRLRTPDEQGRRIPRVVEIAPFQFEDLGDPQASAPHDERRGAGLMPVVGRQRVQKALDLVGRPVVRNIHGGRVL